MPSNEDDLVAEIVVDLKFCSREQIEECRLIQAQDPDPAALGDILQFNGIITSEQFATVQSMLKERREKLAPPANAAEVVPKPEPKATRKEPSPPPEKPAPPPAPAGPPAKTIKATCIMCDAEFSGAVDAGGRVQCPDCKTSFVPK